MGSDGLRKMERSAREKWGTREDKGIPSKKNSELQGAKKLSERTSRCSITLESTSVTPGRTLLGLMLEKQDGITPREA